MACLKLTYKPTLQVTARTENPKCSREAKSCAGAYQYKFGAKEWQDELGLNIYDFEARNYDPTTGRTTTPDPLADNFASVSPYSFFNNSPMIFVDPTGMSTAPIYDTDGNLLGTDDQGLQGRAIVMEKEDFTQGMSHDEALSKSAYDPEGNPGQEFYGFNSEEAYGKFVNSFVNLENRPDYDGVLTLAEANDHFRNGEGGPLYVDVSKINLSPLKNGDIPVGQSQYVNFLKEGNVGTGVVYGTLKVTATDSMGGVQLGNTKTGQLDEYDFKVDWSDGRDFRNATTVGGGILAGKGTIYNIYGYGSTKLPSSN